MAKVQKLKKEKYLHSSDNASFNFFMTHRSFENYYFFNLCQCNLLYIAL